MTELLLLQILLGMFIWFNFLISIQCLREIVQAEPCTFKQWYIKYFVYCIMIIIIFLTWPFGVIKIRK